MSKCYLVPNFNFELQSEERKAAFLENYKAIFRMIPTGEKLSIIIVTNAVSINGENVTVSKTYIRVPDSLAVIVAEKFHLFTEKEVPEITDDDMVKVLYPKTAFREYAVCDKWNTTRSSDFFPQSISQIADVVAIMNFEPVVSRKGRSYRTTLEVSTSGDAPEKAESVLRQVQRYALDYDILFHKNGEKTKISFLERKYYSETLSEEICAGFCPFLPEECIEDNGFYYGLNLLTYKPIICNRRNMKHPNCFIFGSSGSGKSEIARREIRQLIDNTDDEIIVFDEAGEYAKLCLGKVAASLEDAIQIILSSHDKGYHINPMDFVLSNHNSFEYDVSRKCDVIATIFELIMKRPLSQSETDIVHNAVKTVLAPFVQELKRQKRNYAPEINPTFEDVMVVLLEEYNSKSIGALEKSRFIEPVLFGEEKLYFETLKYRTNIPHYRVTEIAWYEMPSKLDIITHIICIDYAHNRLQLNKQHKAIHMYWDDADCVLNDRFNYSEMFLSLLRTSRKCNGTQTLLAFEFSDILQSAADLFPQFELFEFLRQHKKSREAIQAMYNFSKQEMSCIAFDIPCGKGLFYKVGNNPIPFTNVTRKE